MRRFGRVSRRVAACGALAGVALLAGCASGAGPAPWWHTDALTPGRSAVGVETTMLADSSRVSGGGRPRPVQMTIWFPAAAVPRGAMTYADYADLADDEVPGEAPPVGAGAADARREFLVSHGLADSVARAWFAAPMLAVRGARPAAGRHRVVLIAQGNGETVADQSVLAEFLASHGFVVATCPSQARRTGEPSETDHVAAAARDQADDLTLMRAALAGRAGADADRVAIVAHSFGARSALYEAMRDPHVDRLVSLDGGIGTATAREVFERDPAFRPAAARIPVLHFYETLDAPMTPDWVTLRKLETADVWIARTDDLHHHHFTDLGAACARWPQIAQSTIGTARTGDAYASVLAWTLAFLETPAPIDAGALLERAPGASGAPERLAARAASGDSAGKGAAAR